MEYTKGKWEILPVQYVNEDIGHFYITGTPVSGWGHNRTIADVGCWKDRPNPLADAHLIAAAPNLYEALNDIIKAASFCHADAGLTIWIDKAKEALAKAEGK